MRKSRSEVGSRPRTRTLRALRAPAAVALALALGACAAEPDKTRPEASATPPAAQAPAAQDPAARPRPAAPVMNETWNAAQIDWQEHDAGLAKAKAEKKPVCLVFYTDWCPHCKNYSHVFEDPKVVERAREFVMVRVNGDRNRELSQKYSPDGAYVPRTYFLSPDGSLMEDVHAPRPKFKYFYDEHDPASLLAGMDAAKKKLGM